MDFELPTNKGEMYKTLQDIFHYYRIDREGYAGAKFEELNLERMPFTHLTESELNEKADVFLAGKHAREIQEYADALNSKIIAENSKKSAYLVSKEEQIAKVEDLYLESERKVEEQAVKNGLMSSGIITEKIAQLENAKVSQILAITKSTDEKIAECDSEIARCNQELSAISQKFSDIHEKEKLAKAQELLDEQDTVERTVFRYNNSLEEKELKYKNSLMQIGVELKLKFMEVSLAEFTKDELVAMGYYEDVIRCVCGYYDRLSAHDAFVDIQLESKLIIFLDEYYQDVLYMYNIRSGT